MYVYQDRTLWKTTYPDRERVSSFCMRPTKNSFCLQYFFKLLIEKNCSAGIVLPTAKGKGKKRAATSNNPGLKDFKVEYSKSSRATCKHCDIKICKVIFSSSIEHVAPMNIALA